MEILLNVDCVTSNQNLRGLRQLHHNMESYIRSLKSLGVPSECYGTLLSSILINKVPPDLHLIVSRQLGGWLETGESFEDIQARKQKQDRVLKEQFNQPMRRQAIRFMQQPPHSLLVTVDLPTHITDHRTPQEDHDRCGYLQGHTKEKRKMLCVPS